MNNYALPASLITAVQNNTLTPFVGAGVSMSVKRVDRTALFPSWKDLLNDGAKKLRDDLEGHSANIVEEFVHLNDIFNAAEHLKKNLSGNFGQWISQAISRLRIEANESTFELPKLIWEIGSSLILTTNYDLVLRWTCPYQADLQEWSKYPQVSTINNLRTPVVWHLHGIVQKPQEIVFSESDYNDLYNNKTAQNEAFRTILHDVSRNRTLLFVGFSFDDVYLQAEMLWLKKCFQLIHGNHYILVQKDRVDETRKRLSEITNIKIIPFEDYGPPLNQLLKKIKDASKRSPEVIARDVDQNTRQDKKSEPIENYLLVSQQLNGAIQMPGADGSVPIDQVWVEPKFIQGESIAPMHKAISLNRSIVVEANAGSGKSTFARFMTTILARDFLKIGCPHGPSWQRTYLGVEPGENTQVPIFIILRNYNPARGIDGFFSAASPPINKEVLKDLMAKFLIISRVAFILDGLDETPLERRNQIVENILLIKRRWKDCYFIITTRPIGIQPLEDFGLSYVRLAPFDPYQLIKTWSGVVFKDPSQSRFFLELAGAAVSQNTDLKEMARYPLTVAFLCYNFLVSGTLPTNKATLHKSLITWIFNSRATQRIAHQIATITTESVLETIAYLQITGEGNQVNGAIASSNISFLINQTSTLLSISRSIIERIIHFECSLGNFIENSHGRISFWHLNLRDYFAARKIISIQLAHPGSILQEVKDAFEKPFWKDCMDIFVGLLAIERPEFITFLIDDFGDSSGASLTERISHVAIRSRIYNIASSHGLKFEQAYKTLLHQEFEKTFERNESMYRNMSSEDRIDAYRTLGRLQLDFRLFGKPSARAIRFANAVVGMGRFLVTVQEFARFVRLGGYQDSRWWPYDKLRQATSPMAWEEQKQNPNYPVVGINWQEATAYCSWLTNELGDNIQAELPTMEVWISAINIQAQAESSVKPSSITARLNSESPVGSFPERMGPRGHEDICDTAWEWIGPKNKKSRRRKFLHISSSKEDNRLTFITRNSKGLHKSLKVGFRIMFTFNSNEG